MKCDNYGNLQESTEQDDIIKIISVLLNTLEAISNDCIAWLDGEMDSLSQGDLLQAFHNAAQSAINYAYVNSKIKYRDKN